MLTTYLVLLLLTERINSLTVITKPEINVTLGPQSSIILKCSYLEEQNEVTKEIIWSKITDTGAQKLAKFEIASGDAYFFEGTYLKNRSTLFKPENGSTSATLKINDVKCEDDGSYECYITYKIGNSGKETTNMTTVFIQVAAEYPTAFSLYPEGTLKENDQITLSCFANVGNPKGYIAMWKLNESSQILLNGTQSLNQNTNNCTTSANLTITYNVSRDDNGAYFRCSSRNRQTQGQAPSNDTGIIDVQYGPSHVEINISPSNPSLVTGTNVNLTCISDGNPVPALEWKFNSTYVRKEERFILVSANKTLLINNINVNDSGIYSCEASNSVKGETLNKSSNVTLKVREKEEIFLPKYQPKCKDKQCGVINSCSESDGKAICTINIWSIVSFAFIFLTFIFALATAIMCIKRMRKKDKTSTDINGDMKVCEHVPSETNDYEFGGYSDPKDMTKLCSNMEKSESRPDNTAYADPVDMDNQYSSVQKISANPTNPPNVYDGAWV